MLVAPHLRDRVVDDRLELLLGQRLGHELLDHVELVLLGLRAFLVPGVAERLGRLDPLLSLALQNLELLPARSAPAAAPSRPSGGSTGSG